MDLTRTYFEQICPELLDSEIKILIDNVLDLYKPENVYPQAVRVVAKGLFPDIIKDEKIVHIDGRDKLKKAIDLWIAEQGEDSLETDSKALPSIVNKIATGFYWQYKKSTKEMS